MVPSKNHHFQRGVEMKTWMLMLFLVIFAAACGGNDGGEVTVDDGDVTGTGDMSGGGKETCAGDCRGTPGEPDGGNGDVEAICTRWALPGDEQNPGDDCWDPPANYCADGASQAEAKACAPDFSTCCKFANYCIPCGWVKCSYCEDDSSREERVCTPDDERSGNDEVPECAEAPVSIAGNPACPVIEWSEPVCVEWE
jgi:hypothetical protein